jgi:hypothetical protein
MTTASPSALVIGDTPSKFLNVSMQSCMCDTALCLLGGLGLSSEPTYHGGLRSLKLD